MNLAKPTKSVVFYECFESVGHDIIFKHYIRQQYDSEYEQTSFYVKHVKSLDRSKIVLWL